jgi:anti-anti-sigma regulatory factor
MKIAVEGSNEEKILRIDIGERLDLSAYKAFGDAIARAMRDPQIAAIVVDFCETHLLFDSGKAILLDMTKQAWYLGIPLCLINASPQIRHKLPNINRSMYRPRMDNNVNHLRVAS